MQEKIHFLISLLKDLSIELGYPPSKVEFDKVLTAYPGMDSALRKCGWKQVCLMAGIGGTIERNKIKLGNEIFNVDIRQQIESHQYKEIKKSKIKRKIMCLGDIHFPFHCKNSLNKVYQLIEQLKPDVIIQMGDLYDQYAHSKFPRSQNIYTPENEEKLAREEAEKMWSKIILISPNSKKYQIMGNHDIRMMRQTLANMPSIEHAIRDYLLKLMTFNRVETIADYRSELVIDGIMFHHGYRSKLGDHSNYVLGNMCVAHTHHGGTVFRKYKEDIFWELNAGFLADHDAKALSYTPQKATTQTLGIGWIDELGPRFIPF